MSMSLTKKVRDLGPGEVVMMNDVKGMADFGLVEGLMNELEEELKRRGMDPTMIFCEIKLSAMVSIRSQGDYSLAVDDKG